MFFFYQGLYARDALCKALYSRMFSWLVARINDSIKVTSGSRTEVMGVLDIYGFEVFEVCFLNYLCLLHHSQEHYAKMIIFHCFNLRSVNCTL